MNKLKNHFRQHIPRFIDSDNSYEFDFDSIEKLINSSFVQLCLSENPNSTLVKHRDLLMITHNEGFNWRVIGYISNPDDLKLSEWTGAKYIGQYQNGIVEVFDENSENPVVSSCGNELTLKDGTVCKNIKYKDWMK